MTNGNTLSLDQQAQINLDNANSSMKNKGLRCIVYAKKRIAGKALSDYLENYESLKYSLMPQKAMMETLHIEL